MLYLRGMHGLGDNLYQRAVVRELGPVSLMTPWPQLYADLPVRCVRPQTRLRTQARNVARRDHHWHAVPGSVRWQTLGYDGADTMLQSMMRVVGLQREKIDFSGPPVVKPQRAPYIVVRPATVREEWRADARNPLPEYLVRAVDALKDRFTIISVADLVPGREWAMEPLPFAHEQFHRGELPLEALLALVAGAAGVIGGCGWLVPAAVAYRVPMLLLHGGWGIPNGPQRIFDPRMDTSLIEQAMPDSYCMCNDRLHACDKRISGLDGHIARFASLLERA